MFITPIMAIAGILSAAPQPANTRALVVLLDISGSMGIDDAGKPRLEHGCDLIRELARANPPSGESPILLVTFNNNANQAIAIQTMADLENHLKALRPGGGTSIAKGLREAGKTVERFIEAKRLELLLITDMEDGEKESIAAEQEKLNKLFQKRGHDGKAKSDSLVFVRTWSRDDAGSAKLNEELTGPIVQGGAAERADIGKDQVVNVRLELKVDLVNCEWVETRKIAKARLKASAMFQGTKGPVPSSCALVGPEGQRVVIPPGKDSANAELEFKPTAIDVESGMATLTLAINIDRLQPFPGGIHVIEAPTELTISISLPKLASSIRFAAKTNGQPIWHQLAGDVVSAAVTVSWEVDGPVERPFPVLITGPTAPGNGLKVLVESPKGSTTFTGLGTMQASRESTWSFTAVPDTTGPNPLPSSNFSTTLIAPAPVMVRPVVLGSPNGKTTGGIAWFFQKEVRWDLSPAFEGVEQSAIEGLKLGLVLDVGNHSAAETVTSETGRHQLVAQFPETGYFGTSRISRMVSFVPENSTTSVQMETLHLNAVREAPGLAMLAAILVGIIFSMLAAAVWKLINSSFAPTRTRSG